MLVGFRGWSVQRIAQLGNGKTRARSSSTRRGVCNTVLAACPRVYVAWCVPFAAFAYVSTTSADLRPAAQLSLGCGKARSAELTDSSARARGPSTSGVYAFSHAVATSRDASRVSSGAFGAAPRCCCDTPRLRRLIASEATFPALYVIHRSGHCDFGLISPAQSVLFPWPQSFRRFTSYLSFPVYTLRGFGSCGGCA